jgi:hypothetical protein
MNCIEARDAMLEAECAELRRTADSPLGTHLSECDRCSVIGDALVRDLDHLRHALVARARVRHPRRRVVVLAGVPIAAALLAVATLATRDKPAAVPIAVVAPAPVPVSGSVSVDVAPGQHAAVFATSDPTVTVVWLSPGVGQ